MRLKRDFFVDYICIMNIVLFDSKERINFLPLTYTRPMADMRMGMMTFRERWEHYLGVSSSSLTEGYLSTKYSLTLESDNLFIHGTLVATQQLVEQINQLTIGQGLTYEGDLIAYRSSNSVEDLNMLQLTALDFKVLVLKQVWELFVNNDTVLRADFELLTKGRESAPIPEHCTVINPEQFFMEEGASISCSVFNASTGPIYIGKNAEVMESSAIRGPFSLGEHSTVKMASKFYGAISIGPHCKVGGEINNSIVFGYSNKGHDGFLGNSVIGEWCNIGADTNTSNLKNDYSITRLWNYAQNRFVSTGRQFCGLIMGDHSKSAINTMFNTATVVGVSSTVFGSGFVKNFVPSFSWGGEKNSTTYLLNKALDTAERVMERRSIVLSEEDKAILEEVFEQSKAYRKD